MFLKQITLLSLLLSISFATSVSLTKSEYDYKGKFPKEHDTKLTVDVPKIGRGLALVASVEDINRFDTNTQQYGVEVYKKFDKGWGYSSLYLSDNRIFLPIYDFTAAYYIDIPYGMEIGMAVKRMSYVNNNVDIIKGIFTFPFIISGTTIMETISFIPDQGTHTLNSKIIYNNEKDIKAYYSFTIGTGIEDFGYFGRRQIEQELHSTGIDYSFNDSWTGGISYSKEFYGNFYTRTGATITIKYNW